MAETPCASTARERNESLHATASIVRRWVLVEQPGAWGRDAPLESRLPPEVASELQARARIHGFRLILLRRGSPAPSTDRHCFIAHSGRRTRWIEEAVVDDPAALLGVDFRLLAQGSSTGFGTARQAPLYLVCTNGRHDPCCARLGRPIVRALLPRVGEAAWECSHIGGDRFAGNLVCLPDGLYFGGLGPDEAMAVVGSYEQGLVELDHYRGRAGDPYAVQAAEFFVRRETGLRGVDEVVPRQYRKAGPGLVEVTVAASSDRQFRVTVGVTRSDDERLLTCASTNPQQPPTFSLRGLGAI